MTRAESRRAKTNGSTDAADFNPTLVNPIPESDKPALPLPQNPTVEPPLEVLLSDEEAAHFQEIHRVSEQLNAQAAALNNQGGGALMMILKQRKLDPKLPWELSPDATKITRKV